MNEAPIQALRTALFAEFERDARGPAAAQILTAYARAHDDWRRYALLDPDLYTRNLVARNEHFELLVLCWNPGQSSPIHNHAGQNCWMAVLEGEIEEVQYDPPRAGTSGPLREIGRRVFPATKVGFINDDIALHVVRPLGERGGTSLHLYSKPIEICSVYDEVDGCVRSRRLAYYSIDAVRVLAGKV